MTRAALTDEEIREIAAELVRTSRAEQGLPPKVTDEAALSKVAAILLAPNATSPGQERDG